jgi:hypothetical protein
LSTAPEGSRRLAIVAFLALLAPAYFLLAVFLKYGLGIDALFDPIDPVVTHPLAEAIVLLGPVVALVASTLAVLRVQFRRQEGNLVSTVMLRLSAAHLVALVLSAGCS